LANQHVRYLSVRQVQGPHFESRLARFEICRRVGTTRTNRWQSSKGPSPNLLLSTTEPSGSCTDPAKYTANGNQRITIPASAKHAQRYSPRKTFTIASHHSSCKRPACSGRWSKRGSVRTFCATAVSVGPYANRRQGPRASLECLDAWRFRESQTRL
jgi:hypothetical protein